MLTVITTHGNAFRESGRWKIQVTLSDGARAHLSANRPSELRRRLADRGVTTEEIARLVPRLPRATP